MLTLTDRIVETANNIAARENLFFAPLTNVPHPLRRMIWSLVLGVAINLPAEVVPASNFGFFQPRRLPEPNRCIGYMLVCREWAGLVRSIRAVRPLIRSAASATTYVDFIRQADFGWRTTNVTMPEPYADLLSHGSADLIIYPALVLLPLLHTLKTHVEMSPEAWSAFCSGPASSIVVLVVKLSSGQFQIPRMPLLSDMDLRVGHAQYLELHATHNCVFPMLACLELRDYTFGATLLGFFASQRFANAVHAASSLMTNLICFSGFLILQNSALLPFRTPLLATRTRSCTA